MNSFLLSLIILASPTPWDRLQAEYAQTTRGLQQISDWNEATATAIAERRPLVVFVGIDARPIPRAVSVRYDDWPGVPAGVVVYRYAEGELRWSATLPPTATNEQIAATMNYPPAPDAGAVGPVDKPGSGDKIAGGTATKVPQGVRPSVPASDIAPVGQTGDAAASVTPPATGAATDAAPFQQAPHRPGRIAAVMFCLSLAASVVLVLLWLPLRRRLR